MILHLAHCPAVLLTLEMANSRKHKSKRSSLLSEMSHGHSEFSSVSALTFILKICTVLSTKSLWSKMQGILYLSLCQLYAHKRKFSSQTSEIHHCRVKNLETT